VGQIITLFIEFGQKSRGCLSGMPKNTVPQFFFGFAANPLGFEADPLGFEADPFVFDELEWNMYKAPVTPG